MNQSKESEKVLLNPFAFPNETNARYTLLIISALTVAFSISSILLELISPQASGKAYNFPQAPPEGLPPAEFFAQNNAFLVAVAKTALQTLGFPALLFLIILLLATILYLDHPRRIRARYKLHKFKVDSDPRLAQEISFLSSTAGLKQPPSIEIGPIISEQSGQAFGIGQMKNLRLGSGLRLLLRKSPGVFRALVRHELAHIAHRDIGRTYFSQSLWISTILVTIVPLIFASAWVALNALLIDISTSISMIDSLKLILDKLLLIGQLFMQSLALILLVTWIWAGILRTRECYADWKAALWGSRQELMNILGNQSQNDKRRLKLFNIHLHPLLSERWSVLNNAHGLLKSNLDLPFIAGALTIIFLDGAIPAFFLFVLTSGTIVERFPSWLILFAHNSPGAWVPFIRVASNLLLPLNYLLTILVLFLPLIFIAYLFNMTLGIQIQRKSILDLMEHKKGIIPYLSLFSQSGIFVVGMFVGNIIVPQSFLFPTTSFSRWFILPWLICFILLLWMVLSFIQFFSCQLLSSHTKMTLPSGKSFVLNLEGCFLFISILIPFFSLLIYAESADANYSMLFFAAIVIIILVVGICFAFVFHLLALFLYRSLKPAYCPVCGKAPTHIVTAETECANCRALRTPWLFVIGLE